MQNAALYERTHILIGDAGIQKLQGVNVFLAGTGGVGGHCAEALVRAGVGRITLCDHDVISHTNKNRQLIALNSTIGKSKVKELGKRLRDISQHCIITCMDAFLLPEDIEDVLSSQPFSHIIDCIDSVDCKVALLATAADRMKYPNIKIYSSCGAGGRLDPSQVAVGDLFDTENDALARACRNELRKRGVGPGTITVAYSKEKGLPPLEPQRQESGGRDRSINGTISYMPPLFGLLLSSAVIRDIIDPLSSEKARKKKVKELKLKEAKKLNMSQGKMGTQNKNNLKVEKSGA
eukprot:Tbor_TRINITY_DN1678_c0_g1::TRINITY_DN1678_c0_g1_i1::g.7581::m.7581